MTPPCPRSAVRAALRVAEEEAAVGEGSEGVQEVHQRLAQMEELLGTMNRVMSRFLANEKTSRAMLRFLTGWIGDDSK